MYFLKSFLFYQRYWKVGLLRDVAKLIPLTGSLASVDNVLHLFCPKELEIGAGKHDFFLS